MGICAWVYMSLCKWEKCIRSPRTAVRGGCKTLPTWGLWTRFRAFATDHYGLLFIIFPLRTQSDILWVLLFYADERICPSIILNSWCASERRLEPTFQVRYISRVVWGGHCSQKSNITIAFVVTVLQLWENLLPPSNSNRFSSILCLLIDCLLNKLKLRQSVATESDWSNCEIGTLRDSKPY